MEHSLMAALSSLLQWLAVPEVGLGAVFVIALVSATLLPLGSEPAVWGLVVLRPDLFWPAVLVATVGNTLGGALTWATGYGAQRAASQLRAGHSSPQPVGRAHERALSWLHRFGASACLLSWLPIVGDPLCAVAGWLRLPFWPCVLYMAVGKLGRYVCMTSFLLWVS